MSERSVVLERPCNEAGGILYPERRVIPFDNSSECQSIHTITHDENVTSLPKPQLQVSALATSFWAEGGMRKRQGSRLDST